MELLSQDEILRLSAEERIQLIGQLWESLLSQSLAKDEPSLTEAQKAELARRLSGAVVEPPGQMTWEQLKTELARRKAQQDDKNSHEDKPATRNIGGIIGPY